MRKPHGTNFLDVQGSILIVTGVGPWNEESISLSVEEIDNRVEALYGQPWAALLLFEGDAILVPEAREQLLEIVKQDRLKGRVATALVLTGSSIPKLVVDHLGALYKEAGDAFESFDDQQQAIAWLEQQISAS